jgi:hypothetical protein
MTKTALVIGATGQIGRAAVRGPGAGRLAGPGGYPTPVVLDMSAAQRELGYHPATGYVESLPETVRWLVDAARGRDWRRVFPDLAGNYRTDYFDYAAEHSWLAGSPPGHVRAV